MSETDVSESKLRERVAGEQMIHRLREWTDGDTAFGVTTFNLETGTSSGKTYRVGTERGQTAREKARQNYDRAIFKGVTVLFRATVRNPRTEPRNPMDPGEPPLKFGTLEDVEILEFRQTGENEDEGDE